MNNNYTLSNSKVEALLKTLFPNGYDKNKINTNSTNWYDYSYDGYVAEDISTRIRISKGATNSLRIEFLDENNDASRQTVESIIDRVMDSFGLEYLTQFKINNSKAGKYYSITPKQDDEHLL